MRKFIILFALCLLCASCSTLQKITYKTDDIIPISLKPIPITVEIKEFVDIREEMQENQVLFHLNKNMRKFKGATTCINSEHFYKNPNETVSFQVSRIFAEHLHLAKVFDTVIFNQTNIADYFITGDLSYLYGEQPASNVHSNNVVMAGLMFGAIGGAIAAATSKPDQKRPPQIVIEIKDLNLYRKNGELVKHFGDFRREYDEKLPVNASCWCIYKNVNDKLKEFNYDLARKIKEDLANISF